MTGIVIDSCGWISWLANDTRAPLWEPTLRRSSEIVVPTVVLYEVVRWIRREQGDTFALTAAAFLQEHEVADLDGSIALLAAELGLTHRLAMADALVYAHARVRGAELWTSDAHFAGLPGVAMVAH